MEPNPFVGTVNRVDVNGNPTRCQAFVTATDSSEIQVTAEDALLANALISASARAVEVEAYWSDDNGQKKLTRLILSVDRP